MLKYSDDVYKCQLEILTALFRYWIPSIRDVAHVDEEFRQDYWRVRIQPLGPSACPFVLVLKANQKYDLSVGTETFKNCPVSSLDVFQPLAAGITDGNVSHRFWTSAATDTLLSVETTILLSKTVRMSDSPPRKVWHRKKYHRSRLSSSSPSSSRSVSRVKVYAPYHLRKFQSRLSS